MKSKLLLILICLCISSCNKEKKKSIEVRTQVEVVTTNGKILIELYNETPKHRDNFIKLVNERFYDGILFHRVIDNFIIQTGDPKSRDAKPKEIIGGNSVGYIVPSEIIDTIFHKRGTLSAAHDGNPDFSSNGSHFVITQRGPIADSSLKKMETHINNQLAFYHTLHAESNASTLSLARKYHEQGDYELYKKLYDSILNTIKNPDFFTFPEKHAEYYKKYGGAPFNDRIYTVFGEVITGMDIVDSIAGTETDENNRPIEDVRVISMRIVNKQK